MAAFTRGASTHLVLLYLNQGYRLPNGYLNQCYLLDHSKSQLVSKVYKTNGSPLQMYTENHLPKPPKQTDHRFIGH